MQKKQLKNFVVKNRKLTHVQSRMQIDKVQENLNQALKKKMTLDQLDEYTLQSCNPYIQFDKFEKKSFLLPQSKETGKSIFYEKSNTFEYIVCVFQLEVTKLRFLFFKNHKKKNLKVLKKRFGLSKEYQYLYDIEEGVQYVKDFNKKIIILSKEKQLKKMRQIYQSNQASNFRLKINFLKKYLQQNKDKKKLTQYNTNHLLQKLFHTDKSEKEYYKTLNHSISKNYYKPEFLQTQIDQMRVYQKRAKQRNEQDYREYFDNKENFGRTKKEEQMKQFLSKYNKVMNDKDQPNALSQEILVSNLNSYFKKQSVKDRKNQSFNTQKFYQSSKLPYIDQNIKKVISRKSLADFYIRNDKRIGDESLSLQALQNKNSTRKNLIESHIEFSVLKQLQILDSEELDHQGLKFETFYKHIFRVFQLGQEKAQQIFEMYDKDKKGYLNKQEFQLILSNLQIKTIQAKIDLFAEVADQDNNHLLSFEEVFFFARNSLITNFFFIEMDFDDSSFLVDLTKYFAKEVFRICGVKLSDEIRIDHLRDLIMKQDDNSDFLIFFCNMQIILKINLITQIVVDPQPQRIEVVGQLVEFLDHTIWIDCSTCLHH